MGHPAPERWTYRAHDGHRTSKVRLGALAGRQFGRVTWAQMHALGISPGTVRRWVATGYLVPVLPRVYAVGHVAQDERARMFGLVLFAGPEAALSHGTAAHWRGWLRYPIRVAHVSTPRRIRTRLRGVTVHDRRRFDREPVDGVPCTRVTQTLLDLAATEPLKLVHRALAQLDFERKLEADAIRAACGRGRPGSAALTRALHTYMPQLARTRSDLEDDFLFLCARHKLPLPEVNVLVDGVEVDCYWPDLDLIVELDGVGNHGTAAQRARDQERSLRHRANGRQVVRYTGRQLAGDSLAVAADLRSQICRSRIGRSLS